MAEKNRKLNPKTDSRCRHCGRAMVNCECSHPDPGKDWDTERMAETVVYCSRCMKVQQECDCRNPKLFARVIVGPPPAPGLSAGAQAEKEAEASLAAKQKERDRENRIEALRAASRIVAAIYTHGGDRVQAYEATTEIAEQFAKWLETGER